MDICPHCGENSGYYVKLQMRGRGIYYYNFNNTVADDNSTLHDYLSYEYGKWAYCIDCNKRLFKVNKPDLINNNSTDI